MTLPPSRRDGRATVIDLTTKTKAGLAIHFYFTSTGTEDSLAMFDDLAVGPNVIELAALSENSWTLEIASSVGVTYTFDSSDDPASLPITAHSCERIGQLSNIIWHGDKKNVDWSSLFSFEYARTARLKSFHQEAWPNVEFESFGGQVPLCRKRSVVKFSQVAGKGSDNPHVPGQKGRFAVVAAKTKDYDVSLVFRACGSADEINSKILDGEGFPAFHHGD